ncbi:hypothetical protein GCM10009795_096660 [Nocardioides hankookensis]|uniref:CopG family transcriptional regulator n=1 Tax=Nocardioides hankookensis TaxID=443157 RepID=A0ABW1LN54_9ACTN
MAGRKSKGDRHAFMTRVPREAADRLIEEAESLGVPYSDLIAFHVATAYGCDMALQPRNDPKQGELSLKNVS